MSENPYNPPRSEVRDRAPDRAIAERPKQVIYAVGLLWISLVLGIPSTVHEIQTGDAGGAGAFVLLFTVLMYGVGVGLNIFVARGHNWARIALLILAIAGMVAFVAFIQEYLDDPLGYLLLNVATLVMDAVALFLLFSRPGALWFRRIE